MTRKVFHGAYQYKCDCCGVVLDTGSDNPMEAIEIARDEGWSGAKAVKAHGRVNGWEWTHFCSDDCRGDYEVTHGTS